MCTPAGSLYVGIVVASVTAPAFTALKQVLVQLHLVWIYLSCIVLFMKKRKITHKYGPLSRLLVFIKLQQVLIAGFILIYYAKVSCRFF